MPHATLGPSGVTVLSDGEPYPGKPVKLAELSRAVELFEGPVLLFAPKGLSGARLAEVLEAAGPHEFHLALAMTSTLPGWSVYGMSPVTLAGDTMVKLKGTYTVGDNGDEVLKQIAPTTPSSPVGIVLQPSATVQSLATVLGGLAYKDVNTAVVTVAKPAKP